MTHFVDIFGQDRAIATIRQAWRADRLPHGLLFAGPKGVGKGTTALALAGLFLCDKPGEADACGQCPACTVLQAGNHPDYHPVYRQLIRTLREGDQAAQDLSIDVVREYLVAPAGRKSVMGRGKVFVIEEADRMTPGAQNALLKTLEEPAGRTLVILLTDQPLALLATIRSRCQMIGFSVLDEAVVVRELQRRGIGKVDAADAARLADGSLGLALRWLDDGVIPSARELERRLDSLLAGAGCDDLPEWFKGVCEAYSARQQTRDEQATKAQTTREGLLLYLRLTSQFFRQKLAETTDATDMERLCLAIDAVARSERYANSNVTTALIFQQFAATLERLFAAQSAL